MAKPHIIVISLILAVIVGVVLVWPKYQHLQELQDSVERKKVELQNRTDHFADIRDVSQKLEEHDEALARISSALPDEPPLPALFDYLIKAPDRSDLSLRNISFNGIVPAAKRSERIKEIRFSLTLSGEYSDFKNFLLVIENSAKLFEAESISFSSPADPEEAFSFQVNLKTHSY